MDGWELLYRLLQGYVLLLAVVGLATVGWIAAPRIADSPNLAGIWFGVAGFGLLLFVSMLVMWFGR